MNLLARISCLIKTKVENNLKGPLIDGIEVWRCGLVV